MAPIIDVLAEEETLTRRAATVSDQSNWSDIEQQRGPAAILAGLRAEDVGLPGSPI